MKKALFAVAAAAAVLSAGAPRDAAACGGALWEERVFVPKPSPPKLVAQAEKDLEGGNPRKALAKASSAYGDLAKAEPGADNLKNRALRISALAVVRSKGELKVAGQKEATPQERLAWAAKKLEALSAKAPDNPTVEGDLGEGLAAAGRDLDAYGHLAKLADKDLLGTAEGYSALSRLQFAAGLTSKSAKSLARCEAMAADRAVCGLAKAPEKKVAEKAKAEDGKKATAKPSAKFDPAVFAGDLKI